MIVSFTVIPIDKGESLSQFVSQIIKIVEESGLEYRLNPMGTVVEGEWDEVMGVVKACFDRMRDDCSRISLAVKVDYRKGRKGRLDAKIKSVEDKLGIDLNK